MMPASHRPRLLNIAVPALVVIAVTGCSTAPRFIKNWQHVRIGMSQREVLSLLGEPTAKQGPAQVKIDHGGDSEPSIAAAAGIAFAIFGSPDECWEYYIAAKRELTKEEMAEEIVKSLFGPRDKSHVIYFDQNGKVNKMRRPTTTAGGG